MVSDNDLSYLFDFVTYTSEISAFGGILCSFLSLVAVFLKGLFLPFLVDLCEHL